MNREAERSRNLRITKNRLQERLELQINKNSYYYKYIYKDHIKRRTESVEKYVDVMAFSREEEGGRLTCGSTADNRHLVRPRCRLHSWVSYCIVIVKTRNINDWIMISEGCQVRALRKMVGGQCLRSNSVSKNRMPQSKRVLPESAKIRSAVYISESTTIRILQKIFFSSTMGVILHD